MESKVAKTGFRLCRLVVNIYRRVQVRPRLKLPLLPERFKVRRSELDTLERRSYPDPWNNLDQEDLDISQFDSPALINKWILRSHGNNETSAKIFRWKTEMEKFDEKYSLSFQASAAERGYRHEPENFLFWTSVC